MPSSCLSFLEIRRPPLVIQLARHCPMISDRPPIHRFNAIEPRVAPPFRPFPSSLSEPPSEPPRDPPVSPVVLPNQIGRNTMTNDARGRSISSSQTDSHSTRGEIALIAGPSQRGGITLAAGPLFALGPPGRPSREFSAQETVIGEPYLGMGVHG